MLSKNMISNKHYRDGVEITKEEYERILDVIHNKPSAPDGYGYRLTAGLTWELYALPAIADGDEEATADDYKARAERAEAALDKLRAAAESSTVLKALLEKFDIL